MDYGQPDEPVCKPAQLIIECVITCVNNADILAYTIGLNKAQVDRLVIITAPEDKATRKLCEHYQVECVLTDEFRSRWGEFRKGAGINEGLKKCHKKGWLLHLDADILLPPHFRSSLDLADLDESMIYGCDRLEFKNFASFHRYFGAPEPQRQNMFVHTTATGDHAKIGTRIAFNHTQGWVPIGFFQLWHGSTGRHSYPSGHTSAAREDVLFPAQWPRKKRSMIPEVIVYHLESEDAPMAVNWGGRKTKPFNVDSV